MTGLRELGTIADFESALARSADRPLLIFKHSLTCRMSAYAREAIEDFLARAPAPVDAYVVHVQTARALCSALAERFGIRHASPQLFLVVHGQVMWHASHHGITEGDIAAALQRAVPR